MNVPKTTVFRQHPNEIFSGIHFTLFLGYFSEYYIFSRRIEMPANITSWSSRQADVEKYEVIRGLLILD